MNKFSRALWQQCGKRKESLQLHLWNLIICIKKLMQNADWRDDISNDVITLGACFHMFFIFCLYLCSF